MPSIIPYDPSIVLGNLVPPEKLQNLEDISALLSPADNAEDKLNSYISLKRSIDMTIQELINLKVDPKDLIAKSADINDRITEAAVEYAEKKMDAEDKIQPLKSNIQLVNANYESPIDYNKSQLKKFPLSADSMKLNVQYFSYDENIQDSTTHAATISSFISDETSFLGDDFSEQASVSASAQTNSQTSRHKIAGTLVISVTCTHKDALVFAPFILDVDKAIRVWNKVNASDPLDPTDGKTLLKLASQSPKQEASMTLVSGATFGSCFVGMIHVLNNTSTTASEIMYSVASKLQGQFKIGGWFASESGGFGVEGSFSDDAKNLLSAQNITSHCSLVTVGSIPSIKSNNVQLGVKKFADDDGASSMAKLEIIQGATAAEQDSVDASASAARTGGQMIALSNAKIKSALSALADIDDKQNKMLDINSMMDALDDYVDKCLSGNVGVPINYYIKPITKSQLAQMWVAKYYPGKFLEVSGDDSDPKKPAPGGN